MRGLQLLRRLYLRRVWLRLIFGVTSRNAPFLIRTSRSCSLPVLVAMPPPLVVLLLLLLS